MNVLMIFVLSMMIIGCTSNEEKAEDPIKPAGAAVQPQQSSNSNDHCFKWPFEKLPPIYLKEQGIMVTRITDPCVTINGESGFLKGADWMAMGFPCTGGPGKVEWKGSFYKPKMLSFIIANSCAMQPKDASALRPIGVTNLQLTPESELLAFYPFATEYWELLDYGEADTGYIVEIRKQSIMQKAWSDFRKNIPLRLRIFGRENAWVRGRGLYRAEVELSKAGKDGFQLKVIDATPITEAERTSALGRCESLRPARNCTEVFSL